MQENGLALELLPETFAVCRLRPDARVPSGRYVFWAQTPDEKSLVCLQDCVPAEAEKIRRDLRCLRVAGVLDLELIGILARLSALLAGAEVPLFAVSTWDTDYLFLPADGLERALAAFRQGGVAVGEPPQGL